MQTAGISLPCRVAAAAVIIGALLAGTALGQSASPEYQRKLLRLSEVLGAAHYLNRLCGGQSDQLWRNQMVRLLNAESPSPPRRAEMVNRFNRGFQSYQQSFLKCSPAAAIARKRFFREGALLAQSLSRDRTQ